ncbi:hydrogenase expression/formation protein HypC [Anaerocolumna jejuensis DSM 15929]|jgi:hydrogenase expression/formation protein HypC|uniref:Hydrogenase expression/formation protein HypC n=1 Tax=Anaerocolumna jejuensis DSM 15929 TaxID=1121322 RepID=A0A1M7C735_9FIRM|nr:HypC/HybG/HupF family hydrogenase formation chaperone [Anaerocolumna jejuensis]SHL63112.1 hydrogenase expression/formation protein HypC [Anaerocolumna jejuensis DSM 15929]
MCVAIPGKIIEIHGDTAKADIMGNIFEANISLVDAKLGDYILIHAGFAIEVVQTDQAQEMIDIFAELDEVIRNDTGAGKVEA